jgi:hypothetical protein
VREVPVPVPVGHLDLDLDPFGKRLRMRTVWLVVATLLHYRVRLVLWMASNVRCISWTR